jgi:hypothetical protein
MPGFCAKCAVKLAMEGLALEEMLETDQINIRVDIKSFLSNLKTLENLNISRLMGMD